MSKRIGVGVISLGWMGRLHARSYRALSERYQGLGAEVRLLTALPMHASNKSLINSYINQICCPFGGAFHRFFACFFNEEVFPSLAVGREAGRCYCSRASQ